MPILLVAITTVVIALTGVISAPIAQAQGFSNCQAIASAPWSRYLQPASLTRDMSAFEVTISYVGHATFRITAPDGTVIATDFTGYSGSGGRPDVVTMNRAHTSHWTPYPDPAIPHVLPGWNPEGGPAKHFLQVGEVLIRNVPTDIRSFGSVEPDGNSIFIFEIAGLCLGHLGHLHQPLSDAQIAQIGRLDIVFVPIDGTYTMNQGAMMEVVERLRSSLVIPMHWWSDYSLGTFLSQSRGDGLAVRAHPEQELKVTLNTLPKEPTLLVLPREAPF